MNIRIYPPLIEAHHLVNSPEKCPICDKGFEAGQRISLVPMEETSDIVKSIESVPVHARCVFYGIECSTPKGNAVIVNIKDGDGSPFPIVTKSSRGNEQWKVEEITILR